MRRVLVIVAVAALLMTVSLKAQAPQGPPMPGPEVKRLAYQVGTWKVEGEAKPFGPMPGGKFSATEKCEWLTGGFFITCHNDGTSPMGNEKAVSFTGYDANKKMYTYNEFSSMGERIDAKGTVDGDTWHWTAEDEMGGVKMSVRVTVKEVSKTEYTFKLEMSQNGGEFTTVEVATGKKVM
jgi:hypothetical protein